MHLSINPTYFCNFECSHCYLGIENLKNKKQLNLFKLESLLSNISDNVSISHIDLYGGEIGLLPIEYLNDMEIIIRKFYNGIINIITNFSNIHEYFYRSSVEITVSYDYIYREHHNKVLSNIISFDKPVHIIVLAIDDIIKNQDSVSIMHNMFSTLSNVESVEIKPYSGNQYNNQTCTYLDYEDYVKLWLNLYGDYELVNRKKIQDCKDNKSSSYSDDHIYITPDCNISVLDFDTNDDEFFLSLNNYDEYIEWCTIEKQKIFQNPICNKCEFLGRCLSEHLKDVKSLEYGCNGFINLLNYDV